MERMASERPRWDYVRPSRRGPESDGSCGWHPRHRRSAVGCAPRSSSIRSANLTSTDAGRKRVGSSHPHLARICCIKRSPVAVTARPPVGPELPLPRLLQQPRLTCSRRRTMIVSTPAPEILLACRSGRCIGARDPAQGAGTPVRRYAGTLHPPPRRPPPTRSVYQRRSLSGWTRHA
jgi:hypothetical protein